MTLTDKISAAYDDAYNAVLGMERRQQALVAAGAGTVLLLLIFLAMYFYSSALSGYEQDFDKYVNSAEQLLGKAVEYEDLQERYGHLDAAFSQEGKSDPILNGVYELGEAAGIKKTSIEVTTVKVPPSKGQFQEISKTVTIQNVELDKLLTLLQKIKDNDKLPMAVRTLNMKPDQSRKHIVHQAKFMVSTYRPVESK